MKAPKPKAAVDEPGADSPVDLEGLAALESRSSQISSEEIAALQAAQQASGQSEAADETVRTCPNCGKQVHSDDPYVEILCSQCWNPIPARIKGAASHDVKRRAAWAARRFDPGQFYAGLVSAWAYPVQAFSSLLSAVGVAIGAILIPVAVMTAGANLMEQSAVGTPEGTKAADLSGVQIILITIFGVEVFFFSAVAVHAFLDVVRTTVVGHDRAPSLTWSPRQWGKSLAAYLVLALYVGLMTYVVAALAVEGDVNAFLRRGDISGLVKAGGTGFVAGMVVLSLFVPMNLIGLSLGSVLNGIHPVNVVKSIRQTHAHYGFLLMLLCVFVALFAGAFVAIQEWFLPQVRLMSAGSAEGHLMQVLLGLLAWGLVMGFFFYGVYVMARLHGLFARTFLKRLAFDTQ